MRRPYQIFIPLFSLFLARVDLTDLMPLRYKGQILKVYDGDTVLFKLGKNERKVRLLRIDAPEKDQNYLSGQQGAGEFSTECLRKNLAKEEYISIEGHDMYGRILGDFEGVSLRLVEQGCVSLYPYARFRNVKEKYLYLQTYFKARRLKKGLWALGGIMQPKAWRSKNKGKDFLKSKSQTSGRAN